MADMFIFASIKKDEEKKVIDEDLTYSKEEDAIKNIITSMKSVNEKLWNKYNDDKEVDIYLYQLNKDHHPCLYKKVEVEKDDDSYKIDDEESYVLPDDFEPLNLDDDSDKKDETEEFVENPEEDEKEIEEACELVDIFFDMYESGIITEESLESELLILEEVVGRKSLEEAAKRKKDETKKRKRWLKLHAKKMGGGFLTDEEKEFLYSREWVHAWKYEDKAKRDLEKTELEYIRQRNKAKERLKQAKKEKAEREKKERQMKYKPVTATESKMINMIIGLNDAEYINESESNSLNSITTAALFIRGCELNNSNLMKESLSLVSENADNALNTLHEQYLIENYYRPVDESYRANAIDLAYRYIVEKTLKARNRNALDDSDFGIPSLRKYPIPDKAHVKAAIQRFNHVEKSYEKELADNLITAMKKFNMMNEVKVGNENRFKKYLDVEIKTFNESYDLYPFPILTKEFSVANMLPMMGNTNGYGTPLANTPIEDVVAKNNVDLEKYATLYDTTELINDSEIAMESVLPKRNMIFDEEAKKLIKGLKDYVSNPKNDFLEDILKKSINFKKNIYTIRLKEQNGSDSNKIINKIKSCGFKDVDDEGIKAVFEKEVNGLLLTLVYDTVSDKLRITYEHMNKGESVITEGFFNKFKKVKKRPCDLKESKEVVKTIKPILDKYPLWKMSINWINDREIKEYIIDGFCPIIDFNIHKIMKDKKKLSDNDIREFGNQMGDWVDESNKVLKSKGFEIDSDGDWDEGFIVAISTNVMNEVTMETSKDIDDDIQSVVDILNKKGYKTVASCSGHTKSRIKEDVYKDGIYHNKLYTTARIVFADDFKLNPPKGWKVKNFDGKVGIYPVTPSYSYSKGMPDDAFDKWKADYMSELKLWANGLGEKPGPEETKTESVDEFMVSIFGESFKDNVGNAIKKPKIKDYKTNDLLKNNAMKSNITFNGLNILVSNVSNGQDVKITDDILNDLKNDAKVLNSEWTSIINKFVENEKRLSEKHAGTEGYITSIPMFKQQLTLDYVRYTPSSKGKKGFIVGLKNKKNKDTLGGHRVILFIVIKDGKIIKQTYQL